MADALDILLQSRRIRERRSERQAQAVRGIFDSLAEDQRQQQKNILDVFKTRSSLAKSGLDFKIDPKTGRAEFFETGIGTGNILDQIKALNETAKFAELTGNNRLKSAVIQAGGQVFQTGQVGGTEQKKSLLEEVISPQASAQPSTQPGTQSTIQTDPFGKPTPEGKLAIKQREADVQIKKEVATQRGKAIEKQERGAEQRLTSTGLFINQFERSEKELESILPGLTETNIAATVKRAGGRIVNALQLTPETKVLEKETKVAANKMARDIEGGRVTNQDRQVYADAMVNVLNGPSEENTRLASNQLIRMANDGGNIVPHISELIRSSTPTLRTIAQQVLETLPQIKSQVLPNFTSEEAMERAGLNDGVPVMLNGIEGVFRKGRE